VLDRQGFGVTDARDTLLGVVDPKKCGIEHAGQEGLASFRRDVDYDVSPALEDVAYGPVVKAFGERRGRFDDVPGPAEKAK
jgi:hypothetical protein